MPPTEVRSLARLLWSIASTLLFIQVLMVAVMNRIPIVEDFSNLLVSGLHYGMHAGHILAHALIRSSSLKKSRQAQNN